LNPPPPGTPLMPLFISSAVADRQYVSLTDSLSCSLSVRDKGMSVLSKPHLPHIRNFVTYYSSELTSSNILDFKLSPCSECCMPTFQKGRCQETSAYTIQTSRNYPEESIQQNSSNMLKLIITLTQQTLMDCPSRGISLYTSSFRSPTMFAQTYCQRVSLTRDISNHNVS